MTPAQSPKRPTTLSPLVSNFEIQGLILLMCAIDDTLKGTALSNWAKTVLTATEKLGRRWKNSLHYV
jgi:hypothetical protein